ncbi:MAG: hypothetical protein ACRCXT_06310 [Paraclostridium sp.]
MKEIKQIGKAYKNIHKIYKFIKYLLSINLSILIPFILVSVFAISIIGFMPSKNEGYNPSLNGVPQEFVPYFN